MIWYTMSFGRSRLGAWIEIDMTGIVASVLPVAPAWERGLKSHIPATLAIRCWSLPLGSVD